MAEESTITAALRRLAILETSPIRTIAELEDWRKLRKWVIENNLLEEYAEQHYFVCRREITKIQYAPKKSSSLFSRFWTFLKKAGTKK